MQFKYVIYRYFILVLFAGCLSICSCKKIVKIDPPANSITTSETFADSSDASSAVAGIYSKLINTSSISFGSGAITVFAGISSDELVNFSSDPYPTQFYNNALLADNGIVDGFFWSQPYSSIYQANACIEGLQSSTGISQKAKNQFIGEAKFIRAFCYFYLVNFFGDVPLITSTDFRSNALADRRPTSEVLQLIISDLKDAQNLLGADYSYSANERIRANKWAATALLARSYLYTQKWDSAEAQATAVINNSTLYSLDTLNGIFLKNSTEAILQWQLNTGINPYNATPEGFNFIRFAPLQPTYYLTTQLLNAFEVGDLRKINWIDSTTYSGTVYYYPYKYKIGYTLRDANATATEYYMVFRLGEQYLIRAEARAKIGTNLSGAADDLNVIRNRAGLLNTSAVTSTDLLTAISRERKIELFAEWGHRWLDLIRTGECDAVMGALKPGWKTSAQLFPIPKYELQTDPNLTQNVGY